MVAQLSRVSVIVFFSLSFGYSDISLEFIRTKLKFVVLGLHLLGLIRFADGKKRMNFTVVVWIGLFLFCLVDYVECNYCTPVLYDINNLIKVEAMLYNCSSNLQASMAPPSMFSVNGIFHPTLVNVTIAVNTFINVDDISTQVTMDLWFRQYWTDPRWQFPPEMWANMNPAVYHEGIEISPYVHDSTQLNIWLPDTYIIEAVESEVVSELIHLFPNGSIFWSRHFLVTLTEPQMDLHQYPQDSQAFTITLQSFAYSSQYVQLAFIEPTGGVALTRDDAGDPYVSLNQICKCW
jgi:hypothetical protein